ncbi:protein CREG1 [Macrobrachium rosenbergii]|uniref:protein CREG1 n=1 Tax=Macrobrachium rosenbergii TaxID=79674 RepID=UPI0034D79794
MSKVAEAEGYGKLEEPHYETKAAVAKRTKCIFIICYLLVTLGFAVVFMSLCWGRRGVHVASGAHKTYWPDPPPHDQVAKVARYIVHTSDWGSIATFSMAPMIEGFPFANILSLSDGPIEVSTGIPYMYLTPMDLTSHDLQNDSRASLSMTEAQSDYCHKNNYDPESPLCARILITGHIVKVEEGSAEEAFAKNALFSRHPEMSEWPQGHEWFFAKMSINHIYVLDYFGGAAVVDVKEYFEAEPF